MPSAASRSGVCSVSWKSGPDQPTGRVPLALLDQERVVLGDGLVERQGRRDAVLVQDGEDAKDADAIAVLVVAVATDIGKIRLVPAPQPLGAAQGADRQRRIGRHLPVPVLKVNND